MHAPIVFFGRKDILIIDCELMNAARNS